MTTLEQNKIEAPKGCRQTIGSIVVGVLLFVALLIGSITGVDVVGILGLSTPTASGPVIFPSATPLTGTPEIPTAAPGLVVPIAVGQGFGAEKGFWQVYFTAPTGSRNPATYVDGIDTFLVRAIDNTSRTLDIAAFEWNLTTLTDAVLRAHQRGVQVRMVVDSEHAIEDSASTIRILMDAGIPVVGDGRRAFMHNKFMIVDSQVVWTGSWNFTVNDTYRNNNNALALRSRKLVENYQAEFDEMFTGQQFGPTSPRNTPNGVFTQNGIPVQTLFGSEETTTRSIITVLNSAQRSIRFMAFQFTLTDVGAIVEAKASQGVQIEGIFETTGSGTRFSEFTPLACLGAAVRTDGNPFVLHHKVFIVDDTTVITGSYNFSDNARDQNDENFLIISDPDLAAQYTVEFQRMWAQARQPGTLTCP
jgi:phosphatidylserine/phosphatidylglycerophosphate/cardiolipin synthase-like enzyme